MMEVRKCVIITVLFLVVGICHLNSHSETFTYHWELDETPEGSETATVVVPIEVKLLDEDEPIEVSSHSASLKLIRKYSVHLGPEWSPGHAYRLLQTFESIPQISNFYEQGDGGWTSSILKPSASLWRLSDRHIHNDIAVEFEDAQKIVTLAGAAFTYAHPLLAEIEGVRGRFFSKRLHRAVVRFATDNGADRQALERILQERYGVSIYVPDYRVLTGEPSGRFSEFKDEELMAIISMLEEFPKGMLHTPGLNYLVRRLDGTHNPDLPKAAAVAHTTAGYIEFIDAASACSPKNIGFTHRVILHEKAHFLWTHVFDEQLKSDWIELGGWFENPNAPSGWSTTKQVEFVSAYAHEKNPNEDMAESISFYIVNPDKLRSRSPAKYEFIQNRVMHGTRYISMIREDLTFEVYNLYPDYVYPGRIIRVDIQVTGEPEEDKQVTVEVEIHKTSAEDSARGIGFTIVSQDETEFQMWLPAIDANGQSIQSGYIFRGHTILSRHATSGYWVPKQLFLTDANGNARFERAGDFGWQLYINNSTTDSEAPVYVKNSMRLSLSNATTEEGRPYQIVTARWKLIEKTGIDWVAATLNPRTSDTVIGGDYDEQTGEVIADFVIPDYLRSGTYELNQIIMVDIAQNKRWVLFTDPHGWAGVFPDTIGLDEVPATINVQTSNPDTEPPVLDVNRITIRAEPTHPEAPNGETQVDITFRVKDNISGFYVAEMYLRDPQGNQHFTSHGHNSPNHSAIYFLGDPTVYKVYHHTHLLPIGSPPGTWGLAYMRVLDKAQNELSADFTEIVRFEVDDGAAAAPAIAVLPDDTQLLANFPNPFNPETWIPYQLASGSDVHISIYDVRGMLVRTLSLGYQVAGYYTGRGRAAYWDGRNGLGENVASGVYFYQLQTDDISPMRKMVILK